MLRTNYFLTPFYQNLNKILTNSPNILYDQKRLARNTKVYPNGPTESWRNNIYDYSYRKGRAQKNIKLNLPNFDEERNLEKNRLNISPDEIRSKLKEKGIVPHREWHEHPISIYNTNTVFDQYEPPEGDGEKSFLSLKNTTKKIDDFKEKSKDVLAIRSIRSHLENFDSNVFANNEALEIYKKTNEALCRNDENALSQLVTDFCLPNLLLQTELKTIKWNFIKNLENPVSVRIRKKDILDGNLFVQITVRFYSQQTLAIYDKFGRLIHGSEAILKDVLEYIVFERNITQIYSSWKIHSKIVPEIAANKIISKYTSILN